MKPYHPDGEPSTDLANSASPMSAQFGKALYTISDPVPTWSINPDGLVKCSVCEESLTFVFPACWERLYPGASDFVTPTSCRCYCFIETRYDGSAKHHKFNQELVRITPVKALETDKQKPSAAI
jgi:hypothetical protein